MPAVVTRLAALMGKGVDRPNVSLAPNALTKLVTSQDKMPDPPRQHSHGYIHVSSLVRGDCPRMLSLQRRFNRYHSNPITGATRIMWEIGRAVEKHVRAQLIASLPPTHVFGNWKCPCGKRVREGFAKDKGTCHLCGVAASIYVELDLEDRNFYVTGHPDFILILDGRIYPVEIKSLTNSMSANKAKEGFDTLEAPFVNHVLQVSSYHRMMVPFTHKLGLPLGNKAIILYASKDFNGFKSPYPYKEFHVNPFEYKPLVNRIFNDGKAAYEGAHAALPRRLNVCSSAGTRCALNCPMVKQCFALGNGVIIPTDAEIKVKRLRE